jgi:hypothetical protein
MTVQTVKLRLKSLQLAITGIQQAYAQLPRGALKTNELPLFLNFVRTATYDTDTMGDSDYLSTRTYLMWLMVKPAMEGEEGEGEALVEPWIDIVVPYFMARPSLGNLIGISNSVITADSGPKKMVWPGTPLDPQGVYWGIEFQIQVVDVSQRIYAASE